MIHVLLLSRLGWALVVCFGSTVDLYLLDLLNVGCVCLCLLYSSPIPNVYLIYFCKGILMFFGGGALKEVRAP